jgi:voltage-gated potassium channel
MDSRTVARVFELPVIIAALLVIPVVVIESSSSLHEPWTTLAAYLNWVIWLVFVAELLAYLLVVPDRLRWIRQHPLEVAIVVLTPPLLPASLQAIRVLRLLRLLPLLRLAQLGRRAFSTEGLRFGGLAAALTALGGGAAFSAVEHQQSTWDGVWWALTTMTTVGYGDVYPKTVAGRIIGIVMMLIGIGLIAILTGAVAERFLARDVEAIESEIAEEADSVDGLVLEVRAIRERLGELERRLQRTQLEA